jgi:CheY-like chemotaxis protein
MDIVSQGNMTTSELAGRVLVVDDDPLIRALHRAILAKKFTVVAATSGEEALAECARALPDLVLLDVEMPGLNGYETCRQLRQTSTIPIIFVTDHQTMEEQLKAFDAGGDDIVNKPFMPELLLRKVLLAINRKAEREQLTLEKSSMQNMAMNILSSVGESGILLNFMRKSLSCRTYDGLAGNLVEAAQEFGLESVAVVRHANGESLRSTHGEATALERSILEKSSSVGRIFQFKRNLVVNYDKVSIISRKLPEDDDEKMGRIQANITILAEMTEAFCENVEMRQKSMTRAETVQVTQFSETMIQSVQKILATLENSKEINAQFVQVLEALRGGRAQ